MSMDAGVTARNRAEAPLRLPLPDHATPVRIDWVFAAGILGIHLIALLAFLPYFFSWTGVVLVPLGYYLFGTLGINLCFHRLLTHRSFACPLWLEHTFAMLGVCCLQDTPATLGRDPSPASSAFRRAARPAQPAGELSSGATCGWLHGQEQRRSDRLRAVRALRARTSCATRSTSDSSGTILLGLDRARLLVRLLRRRVLRRASAGRRRDAQALQFGLSLLVWGVFVRTVLVWHITWSVNSVTHLWGYRNYETDETQPQQLARRALITNGEGWHNNHHADPRSARHGHRWWELDIGWLTIRLLMMLGLATKIVLPPPSATGSRSSGA